MNKSRHIPWFNPREMDDATVLALSIGRTSLLEELFQEVERRIQHPGLLTHWLITGPRGSGKSFFLRLLQASFKQRLDGKIRFVLLPEELPNIYAPYELLTEIHRLLVPSNQNNGEFASWHVKDSGQLWNNALTSLLKDVPEPLLVVGVENFDKLIAVAFSSDADNSRLRHLMSNEPRIMFVATAVQGDFDENYNQRLFRQFEHRVLTRWKTSEHRDYLSCRAKQQGKIPSKQQLNRIDAYSRYTGGNPRAAAILAATILDIDDPLFGAQDLDATIERMSDYYRALIERIPTNTKKLFDALVRGGEPASQTDLANRTGAQPNVISRAFSWLIDNGYVTESREPGTKYKQYRVLDRLFVQFYRMRYLLPGQRSRLAIMADLLADTLSFGEKWQLAQRYASEQCEAEAQTLAEMALKERQIDINLLPVEWRNVYRLLDERVLWEKHDLIIKAGKTDDNIHSAILRIEEIFRKFPSDNTLKEAIEHATTIACAKSLGDVRGSDLVNLMSEILSLNPAEKYNILSFILGSNKLDKWQELKEVLNKSKKIESTKKTSSSFSRFKSISKNYPLTVAYQDFSKRAFSEKPGYVKIPFSTVAQWALQAAFGWQNANENEYLTSSLKDCLRACYESFKKEYAPQDLLSIVNQLATLTIYMTKLQKVRVTMLNGMLLEELDKNDAAFNKFESARNILLDLDDDPKISVISADLATWALGRMAWCKSANNQSIDALKYHQQAIAEYFSQNKTTSAAWNFGQIARHQCMQIGVPGAWAELEANLQKTHEGEGFDVVVAISQFGDAVADAAREGETHAFAIGAEILRNLAQNPQYPTESVLRALWIDMIEMNVPHGVLRDLLNEWPILWSEVDYPSLQQLKALLLAWLDDLDLEQSIRLLNHKTMDPDLVTTLTALGKALTPQTRHRLGLLQSADEV